MRLNKTDQKIIKLLLEGEKYHDDIKLLKKTGINRNLDKLVEKNIIYKKVSLLDGRRRFYGIPDELLAEEYLSLKYLNLDRYNIEQYSSTHNWFNIAEIIDYFDSKRSIYARHIREMVDSGILERKSNSQCGKRNLYYRKMEVIV